MIRTLITTWAKRRADRRRYNAMLEEIALLHTRDLIDMGADRTELERGAWRAIYG